MCSLFRGYDRNGGDLGFVMLRRDLRLCGPGLIGLASNHGLAKRPYPKETVAKERQPALTATLDYRNSTTERLEQSPPRTTEPPI